MKVPFVDLYSQYLSIKKEIDNAINSVIVENSFIGGKHVAEFESNFANFLGVKNIIGCANGTDSIEIILRALDISSGDEVIVPSLSWISTSEAVSSVGATPVFVDIEKDFYTIDPELILNSITSKTKAIIPVHLYGQPCNMRRIMEIAEKHNLIVIEDCAQSHGSRFENKLTGTFGRAASFSFYPGKNLGAYGDAGAIATDDPGLALKCRMISNHGQKIKHHHVIEGRNSRLDGLQAAILNIKLNYLNEWNQKRIDAAEKYTELLHTKTGVTSPSIRPGCKHVFHLYVIQKENRNSLQSHLKAYDIETAIHYPQALPFLECYSDRNYKPSDFPVAGSVVKNILSLPVYPEISDKMIEYVVAKFN